jgi:galactokinase
MVDTTVTRDVERAARLRDRFEALFGRAPRLYRSPGRINLIGEHTDYNDGFVLPTALSRSCWIAAAAGPERRLIVHAEDLGVRAEEDLDRPGQPTHDWTDYVFGVAAMLRLHGYPVEGATLAISSDVPIGAGLSSSAALEVGVATALLDLFGLTVSPVDVAVICQRAENHVVGARCGIMDQFVAANARRNMALLLDCRTLMHQMLPLPADLRIVACNTLVRHSVAGGDYNTRVAECAAGVAHISSTQSGVWSLRDVDLERLDASRPGMPDTIYRRCRHVVTENQRVHQMAAALEQGNLRAVGPLMAESHRSLRDDYEVSCPELDLMVELAGEVPGVHGSRMTGAGFGGCTVNLVAADAVEEFSRHIIAGYEARAGRRPEIYVTESGNAAERVE